MSIVVTGEDVTDRAEHATQRRQMEAGSLAILHSANLINKEHAKARMKIFRTRFNGGAILHFRRIYRESRLPSG